MARSEAQKAADKRYAAKVQNKYEHFIVHLLPDEYEKINNVIKSAGLSKADFLRWAVNQLEKQ